MKLHEFFHTSWVNVWYHLTYSSSDASNVYLFKDRVSIDQARCLEVCCTCALRVLQGFLGHMLRANGKIRRQLGQSLMQAVFLLLCKTGCAQVHQPFEKVFRWEPTNHPEKIHRQRIGGVGEPWNLDLRRNATYARGAGHPDRFGRSWRGQRRHWPR